MPSVESITDDSLESDCSIIENIPPKGVSFADFMLIFAMPLMNSFAIFCNTKISDFSGMANFWATFCCSESYINR